MQRNVADMFGIGFQEIVVIAIIILLLFGGKKIPELMRGLGKGVRSFKDGMNGVEDEADTETGKEPVKKAEGKAGETEEKAEE